TMTDNRNRTVGELRHLLSKHGGSLGEVNSVAWMFDKKSLVTLAREKAEEDVLMEAVLNAGAEDLKDEAGVWQIISPVDAHQAVVDAVRAPGAEPASAQGAMRPQSSVKLEGGNARRRRQLSA